MPQLQTVMKSSSDPRHKKRIERVQALFALSFQTKPLSIIQPVIDRLEKIDQIISSAAPEWPLAKINKIDLAILRQGTYELLFDKEVPPKVVIDESVEIGKIFGGDSSPSFVNGVLGTILKSI